MSLSFSPFSFLVVNLARFIRPDEITFSGVNSSVAMLACLLAKKSYAFDFTYINVAGGVDPTPSFVPLSSSDPVLAEGSRAIFANEDFYDLCARGALDLCFLGAAQVDGKGNTNVSCIGDWRAPKVRLPGGGGAAVMLPTARRSVTWRTEHSPRTLVDRLDFTTASGGVSGLVTPSAVFEKRHGRLALKYRHPAKSVEQIIAMTGFAFDYAAAEPAPLPTRAERQALRELDADGRFAADLNLHIDE
ncbi:CoA-transferase subunit beta [Brenneria tiliae]|uniref:CoA-transferase subunit beta n=1 Tax=Brenneria tiliae TaxID=2914984 RepID=UPI00201490FF|nr:CoA-transferase [Brenneria tiliae]MCL2898051.1 glutaconate CoA-transferase [Brenneria tiliae]MCL2902132.1 glutaconate CoA-transferase [Brenneria tiliae]